jgi:hypothetical protein
MISLFVAVVLIAFAVLLQINDPGSATSWVFFCLGVGWLLREASKALRKRKIK